MVSRPKDSLRQRFAGGQPNEFRYQIALAPFNTEIEAGSALRVHGTITNVGSNVLNFISAGDDRVLIGIRIHRAGGTTNYHELLHQPPALEPRGIVQEPWLLPNQTGAFEIEIDTSTLEPETYVGLIDLVIEHAFWFIDVGQEPVAIQFRCLPSRLLNRRFLRRFASELPKAGVHAEIQDAEQDLRFLLEAIQRDSFQIPEPILSICRPEACLGWRNDPVSWTEFLSGSDYFVGTFNFVNLACADTRIPISRFMIYLRTALGLQERWDLERASDRFEFVKWYVFDAPAAMGATSVPIPPEVASYLNSDACDPWLGPYALPRLLFNSRLSGAEPAGIRGVEELSEIAQWWVDFLRKRQFVGAALLPDQLKPALLRDDVLTSETGIPISEFFVHLVRNKSDLWKRFDLRVRPDRLLFAFNMILEFADDPLLCYLISPGMRDYFSSPIAGRANSLTRFEFLLAGFLGSTPLAQWESRPWESDAVREWFSSRVVGRFPNFAQFSSTQERQLGGSGSGAAVIFGTAGPLQGKSKLTSLALKRIGITFATFNASENHWDEPVMDTAAVGRQLSRDVSFFHVEPTQVPQIILRSSSRRLARSHKILILHEDEVNKIPEFVMDLIDEVWTPSEESCSRESGLVPIIGMGVAGIVAAADQSETRSGRRRTSRTLEHKLVRFYLDRLANLGLCEGGP